MRGEKLNEFRPVWRAWRRCLRDFVQRQKSTECSGTKIEKEAGLARHHGYWITVGFQGFGHFFLVGIGRRSPGWREIWIWFSLKDATTERGDAGMGRIARRAEQNVQGRNTTVRILVMN